MRREWKPVSDKLLEKIARDTEQDAPAQDYTAAQLYDICRELQELRREKKRAVKTAAPSEDNAT
jgi:hypothetical protein